MKMQIKEFAELTGVSVRTLHYYDEIGLLKPSAVDEQNGYRFYDENSLERLQAILFYRELDFPLKDISKLLSSPNYDRIKALTEQKHLLTLKKERMERLIFALDSLMKGENTMDFKAFDNRLLIICRIRTPSPNRVFGTLGSAAILNSRFLSCALEKFIL